MGSLLIVGAWCMCSKVSQVPSGPKAPSNSDALKPIHIHAYSASQTVAQGASNPLSKDDDELSEDKDLPIGIVEAEGPEQRGLKR